MKYRVAIFDLDGTILDTLDDLTDALNVALANAAFPPRTRDDVRRFLGNGVRRLVERAVPEDTESAVTERVLADFSAYYKDHCAVKTRPYDGILPLLAKLRAAGVKTAVVSNKADFAVQPLVKTYFPDRFDAAVGERPDVARKPAPDMVFKALSLLGETGEGAVFIGDSEVDVKTAFNANLPLLAVAWGFRTEAELRAAGARTVLHTPDELMGEIL